MKPENSDFDPEVIHPYDVRLDPLPIPEAGIFDAPQVKICINAKWAGHIDGLLDRLLYEDAWVGSDEEISGAFQQIRQLLVALCQTSEVCDVPILTNIRIEDCVIEAQYDGVDDWVTIGAIAECAPPPMYIQERDDGLEIDEDPAFGTPTLIYAYYRADATRPAVGFDGRATLPYLRLYDNVPALRLALQVVAAGQNELDTRESRLLLRFGASTLNTRQMYFNTDGTVQIVNSVITPTAKFSVYMDRSTEDGVHIEGRTGLNTGKAVVSIRANNQSGGANDGDAILVRGVNDATYTLNAGIFRVGRYGDVDHGAIRINRQLSTATAKVTRNAYQESTTLLSESGSNYLSRMVSSAYKDGSPVETMRQEVIGSAAAIGVLGATASNRVNVGTVNCGGNAGAKAALDALKTFGWIDGTINLGP